MQIAYMSLKGYWITPFETTKVLKKVDTLTSARFASVHEYHGCLRPILEFAIAREALYQRSWTGQILFSTA